ncbi:hypothetical protein L3V82_04215 [Thiotrichales bacterium 19S3-7]|nr:hypothetical protein [Thiotrichales bacterium 19S3-7]MCF6802676.1 hypothetical protein [Thiotrichales bacterium 19S3-11]
MKISRHLINVRTVTIASFSILLAGCHGNSSSGSSNNPVNPVKQVTIAVSDVNGGQTPVGNSTDDLNISINSKNLANSERLNDTGYEIKVSGANNVSISNAQLGHKYSIPIAGDSSQSNKYEKFSVAVKYNGKVIATKNYSVFVVSPVFVKVTGMKNDQMKINSSETIKLQLVDNNKTSNDNLSYFINSKVNKNTQGISISGCVKSLKVNESCTLTIKADKTASIKDKSTIVVQATFKTPQSKVVQPQYQSKPVSYSFQVISDKPNTWPFITKCGTQLCENSQVFHFLSFNVPEMTMVQDTVIALDAKGVKNKQKGNPVQRRWQQQFRSPNDYEIEDVFSSISQLGAKVIRVYPFSYQGGGQDKSLLQCKASANATGDAAHPCDYFYINNGKFVINNTLFSKFDRVLASAYAHHIRVIIPFIDSQSFWGGITQFCSDLGTNCSEDGNNRDHFYTDQIREKFQQQVINVILNRVNTITKVQYKNDPTILAWETGNELDSGRESSSIPEEKVFTQWTEAVAKDIKQNEHAKQLVMDGAMFIDPNRDYKHDEPDIDIISEHYYPDSADQALSDVRGWFKSNTQTAELNDKVFILGEFGAGTYLSQFLDNTGLDQNIPFSQANIAGALIWSLRSNAYPDASQINSDNIPTYPVFGIYTHAEISGMKGFGNGYVFESYHWPGNSNNQLDTINENNHEASLMGLIQCINEKFSDSTLVNASCSNLASQYPKLTTPNVVGKITPSFTSEQTKTLPIIIKRDNEGNNLVYFANSIGSAQVYKIQRSSNPSNNTWNTIGEVGDSAYGYYLDTSRNKMNYGYYPFEDTSDMGKSSACYRVIACNGHNCSKPSPERCIGSVYN